MFRRELSSRKKHQASLGAHDIRTIQDMMGHSDVKTTMIYTQTVPSRTIQNRKSPLDMDSSDMDL